MRRKRVLIIGAGKSGKTTIADWLDETDGSTRKLANIRYGRRTIDMPGAYLECPWMHSHLIGSAGDAFCVLMLADQSRCREVYPPGFAAAFRVPVIGVITNSDRNPPKRKFCEQQLRRAGVLPPYYYITDNKDSFCELKEVIINYNMPERREHNGQLSNENQDLHGRALSGTDAGDSDAERVSDL